jgi:MFS transporter, DHA1 family, multidrug resistance protein B
MAIYFATHFGAKLAGLLLILNIIIGMIVGLYGGYYSDQVGRKKIMLFANVLRLVAFFVTTLANSPWFFSPELTFAMVILWGYLLV